MLIDLIKICRNILLILASRSIPLIAELINVSVRTLSFLRTTKTPRFVLLLDQRNQNNFIPQSRNRTQNRLVYNQTLRHDCVVIGISFEILNVHLVQFIHLKGS